MSNINSKIKVILENEKIEYFSILPVNECKVINERLMPKDAKSVIIFLVPYRTTKEASLYMAQFSVIRDYHGFSKELFETIIPKLEKAFEGSTFYGFADHSPINERHLAELGGLGEIGKNGLLLNEKYGSYVFIGEIITSAQLPTYTNNKPTLCTLCDKCRSVCPKKDTCISAISQKKKKSEDDLLILKETNTVWGCDKCAEVCPVNVNASLSPIEYFYIDKIKSPKDIRKMTNEQFNSYAFSYRGRKCIEENIKNVFE